MRWQVFRKKNMKSKMHKVNDLVERELLRISNDAEDLLSIIQDNDRSLVSRMNQVQMYLQCLQNHYITISELKGQLIQLKENEYKSK